MVKESQDHYRVRFDAIEDDERRLGDPDLIDASVVEVLSGVGMGGKELKEESVDANKRALGYTPSELLNPKLKLAGDIRLDARREDDFMPA